MRKALRQTSLELQAVAAYLLIASRVTLSGEGWRYSLAGRQQGNTSLQTSNGISFAEGAHLIRPGLSSIIWLS
jgi:hypothetical protein